jgi:3-methyladenine DNA glycosylase AlkD
VVRKAGAGAAGLARDVTGRLRDLADPGYVAGTVAARSPGKPVLGIRIPLLRGAVRDALRLARRSDGGFTADAVPAAAEALWRGQFHEEELAACMLLRLSGVRVTAGNIRRWAGWLDNWLSVDELGGCLGEALVDDPALLAEVESLAGSASPWQRRLYVVGLIRPVREGLDPAAAGRLVQVMQDDAKPVRKASVWLISNVVKARPSAAAQFLAVWPSSAPRPLTRLLERVPVG